jgi:CRISPR-associated protein Cas1
MKKHLNTLYITSNGAYLRQEHETFVVEIKDSEGNWKKAFQAPIHTIENIVCFGFNPISPQLMAVCAEKNVGISFLTETGKFLARVYGAQKGNVLLRKAQYAISDNESESLKIAKAIVAAKVSNYRHLLLRHQRNHQDICPHSVKIASEQLGNRLQKIHGAESLNELNGYEGECASIYFGELSNLITNQKDDFKFNQRSKRPPLDPANALLSFLYAVLANDVRSALETVGLDPQVGFFHRIRPGRPSLALDMMEEFRAYLGDRIMLNLINLKQVTIKDFEFRESGEVRISDNARKEILSAYQKKKLEEITHPFLSEKMTIGLLPHIQAQLLARYIRGDMENYPPFYLK